MTQRWGLIDHPGSSEHKQHATPTPLAGGTALVISLAVLTLILGLWRVQHVPVVFGAAFIVYLFGLWDDARGLKALPKLTGQLLASVLLISADVSVQFMESIRLPFLSSDSARLLDYGITLFWLVGVTNAMNMIDSMDGLAIGLSGIAFLFFVPVTLASGQPYLTELSVVMLGVCAGLYYYNLTPARMFLGDSGAQTLGFIVAAVAMIYAPAGLSPASSWFVPILLVALPVFDTTLVVYSRLRRRQPFYRAHLDHIYHRLVALGLDSRRAVFTVHLASIVISLLAFVALLSPPLVANVIFVGVLLVGGGLIGWLEHRPLRSE
ncbi:MAG: MraY family glycosyltransferase [Anaerolineales bacterium]